MLRAHRPAWSLHALPLAGPALPTPAPAGRGAGGGPAEPPRQPAEATVAAAITELQRLTGLTRLELDMGMDPQGGAAGLPPAALLGTLRSLGPTLRSLGVHSTSAPLPHGTLAAVLGMPRLAALKLSGRRLLSREGAGAPSLRQLTTLRALSELELHDHSPPGRYTYAGWQEQQEDGESQPLQQALPLPPDFPLSAEGGRERIKVSRVLPGLEVSTAGRDEVKRMSTPGRAVLGRG
jgi:hypothetical protein